MAAICGGNLTVWAYLNDVIGEKNQGVSANMEWIYIRHVDSWEIAAVRQEATRKRTSSTGGAAVKFCPDTVSHDVNVVNTLTPDEQWLYGAILANPNRMAIGVTAWFFLGFDVAFNPVLSGGTLTPMNDSVVVVDGNAATSKELGTNGTVGTGFVHHNNGFYTYGTVVPPGFTGSNDGQDPVTADWAVAISTAPLPPEPAFSAFTTNPDPVWTLPSPQPTLP